jgi:hypothetical protein
MIFSATDYDGDIVKDGSETLELGWFAPNELPVMLENMLGASKPMSHFQKRGRFR